MPGHDIVVIGASAGGVEALIAVVRGLPHDLPAALFVVLHIPPDGGSVLPRILSHAGPLPAVHPEDGDPIERGTIYVAPPDYHLLVERDRVRVVRGPRENRYRPAVDPLFRSAARRASRRSTRAAASASPRTRTTPSSPACRRVRCATTIRRISCPRRRLAPCSPGSRMSRPAR